MPSGDPGLERYGLLFVNNVQPVRFSAMLRLAAIRMYDRSRVDEVMSAVRALTTEHAVQLGWDFAALLFAFAWSAGGYWHCVVAILVALSLVVIAAEGYTNKNSN